MSVSEVQQRIIHIQQLVQSLSTPPAATAASGSGFAAALADAQGTLGTSGASPATLPSAGGAVTGDAVVADAKRYLSVPYKWGGTDPGTGLDCSGFVQLVYKDLGVSLPRVSQDQATAGQPVASLAQAQPGDLVCFGSPADHIGIYVGNGQMIEAPHTGDVVKITTITGTPSAIRRVVSPTAATTAAAAGAGALGSTPYADLFARAAAKTGLSASLLSAVAKVESDYDPSAVSPAGAEGLMQLMPGTAQDLGVNPFDPAQAVDGAARLLAGNLQQFGSIPLALAAYNAGPNAVQQYGGIPPYPETQAYVQRVMSLAGLEATA